MTLLINGYIKYVEHHLLSSNIPADINYLIKMWLIDDIDTPFTLEIDQKSMCRLSINNSLSSHPMSWILGLKKYNICTIDQLTDKPFVNKMLVQIPIKHESLSSHIDGGFKVAVTDCNDYIIHDTKWIQYKALFLAGRIDIPKPGHSTRDKGQRKFAWQLLYKYFDELLMEIQEKGYSATYRLKHPQAIINIFISLGLRPPNNPRGFSKFWDNFLTRCNYCSHMTRKLI